MGRRIGLFVAALAIAWCLVCRSATAEPLVVDTAYCSTRGGSFSGQCIHQALVELVADSATFDALLIEPGTYVDCLDTGLEVDLQNFLITTTDFPNLPPEPAVTWSCGNETNLRHLHLRGATNLTIAGIAFVNSTTNGHGGSILVEDSSVAIDSCVFANTHAQGSGRDGGAISATFSDLTIASSRASGCSATGRGGFASVVSGGLTLTDTHVNITAARFGGAIYARTVTHPVLVEGVVVDGSIADVTGGGILIDIADPTAVVTVASTTVNNCSAGAVGGGLAVRAIELEAAVGRPSVALTNLILTGNAGHRGGGLFSEIDTALSGCRLEGNQAREHGGGAAFKPSPCGVANVTIDNTIFALNSADSNGGGLYSLSAELVLRGSRFNDNVGVNGAGVAVDCEAEICTANLPRSSCSAQQSVFDGCFFVANVASDDGGGIHVDNHVLQLELPAVTIDGSPAFADNAAFRGGAVFVATNAQAFVGTDPDIDAAITSHSSGRDRNFASGYGPSAATPPWSPAWAQVADDAYAGENVCGDGNVACEVTAADRFGNLVTLPLVVEISGQNPEVDVTGTRFVLVADGTSGPISDLRVRVFANSPPTQTTAGFDAQMVLRFADPTLPDEESQSNLFVSGCPPGYGVQAIGTPFGDLLTCEPCAPGYYSIQDPGWEPCLACTSGTTTDPSPGQVGASACGWCEVGFGWEQGPNGDDGDGSDNDGGGDGEGECVACAIGTFSSNVTSEQVPCKACPDGLTTDADGANACAVILPQGRESDIVVIIVTAVLVLVGIVALVVSCVRKRNARHGAIGTVLLSLYDVITDYLFVFLLIDENDDDGDLTTLIVVGAGSIGAAFLINLLLTAYVLLRERRKPDFAKWMRRNLIAVAGVAVLGTTNVSVLNVLSSEVFNVDATKAPLSRDTRDLIDFGGVASVLFEDAPQLVVGCIYLASRGSDALVLLTILASAASVLTGLFLRLILCCVVGVDGGGDGDGGAHSPNDNNNNININSTELDSMNPTFEEL